jgi:hypothetical protein
VASVDSGFPLLMEMALKDGPEGVKALAVQRAAFDRFLPA